MTTTRRSVVSLIVTLLLLSACGEHSLQRVGEGSSGWIGGGAPTTSTYTSILATTTTTLRPLQVNLMAAVGLDWANDHMALFIADTPQGVVELTWNASGRSASYVQSHRQTIARALPGLKVPALPDNVVHVTSQLVFGSTAALADDWFAAFGFWTVPPYSESRTIGQAVVLHIGAVPDRSLSCAELQPQVKECRDTVVAGLGVATEIVAPDGVTLHWVDGAYRYRLLYRTLDSPETGALIAGSMVELTNLEARATVAFRSVVSRMAMASPSND